MKIRLSPSGPIIGEAGGGFILASSFRNADIDPLYFVVEDAEPIELKDDPATAAAPFARPELFGIELAKEYTVEANIATAKFDDFTTAVVNVFIDYSTNSGASWNTLSQTAFQVPGLASASNGDNQQWEIETAPLLGSNITGLVEGGSMMVRARWGQVGGTGQSMRFNGTSVVGSAGGFNLKLTKQLPAGT